MKTLFLVAGVVLISAAIFSLLTGGFSLTHRKTDVSAGPVQISHTSTDHVAVAPIVSIAGLLAGAGLIVVGVRSRL